MTPVILSGGAGTRLWPLSRQLRPKQFLNVHGDATMFAQTLARVTGTRFKAPVVLCNEAHRFLVAEEMRRIGCQAQDIILEPVARNTAPAIAVAALRLCEDDPEALILVLPSDQVMDDTQAFHRDIDAGARLAGDGHLVTFGVTPTRPETGYGYICQGEALGDGGRGDGGYKVARFVEKPNLATAQNFISDGGYFWNAGIFLFRAQTLIKEMQTYHPEIMDTARQSLAEAEVDLDFLRLGETGFQAATAISIDFAVMEKTAHAAMVPLTSAWHDIGSWARLWDLGDSDKNGNVIKGEAFVQDVRDTLIHSEKPLVAALGVDGLIIVATDDTVLVLPKDRAEEVKDLVRALQTSGREEAISHSRVYRPWGHYQTIDAGERFLVKQIVVNPGARLSLQRHEFRAEHWVVVEGVARVTNGDEERDMHADQSTYIPIGARHRLENPGPGPLRLIEVQTGNHLSEDDIERLEDIYGRT